MRDVPVIPSSAGLPQKTAEPGNVVFFDNTAEGRAAAQREEKPLLLFFYLPDCSNSKRMLETVFCNAEIQQLARRFVCVKIDGSKETEYCKGLNIKGFPTTLLLSPQGKEVQRLSGGQTADQLALQMHLTIQSTAARTTAFGVVR
ncbi:MAG: thioredoxin family protein [Planctomycetaceae bacterium]|nr:thioredoxin family protein [Planctomycetaceae bacterium]